MKLTHIIFLTFLANVFEKMSKLKLIRSDKLSVKKFKSMKDLQRSTCPNANRIIAYDARANENAQKKI